jgi:hypothetical protein
VVSSVASDSFFSDPTVFGSVCEILSGGSDRMSPFPPDVTPGELAWGLTEILLLDDSPGVVSDEVATYAGLMLRNAGFVGPHPRLPFAAMPFSYRGSSPDHAHKEEAVAETEHSMLVDQFLADQADSLLEELERLPFVSEEILETMASDAARLDFRLRVESEVYEEMLASSA